MWVLAINGFSPNPQAPVNHHFKKEIEAKAFALLLQQINKGKIKKLRSRFEPIVKVHPKTSTKEGRTKIDGQQYSITFAEFES